MKQRVITSIVALCVLLPVLIFHNSILLPVGIAACSVIAVFEMLGCIGIKKIGSVSVPLYLSAAVMPFLIRYLNDQELVKSIAFAAIAVISLYLYGVMIFSHGKYRITQIGAIVFNVLYILIGFNAILLIHDWRQEVRIFTSFALSAHGSPIFLRIFAECCSAEAESIS
jgi:CDP-diglyceride synthetase